MAPTTQMRRRGTPNLGVSPTVQQKLAYISKKLKLSGIQDMQGSTFNIVDTVLLNTNATARQTLSFFTQTQNKSRNFSNFQNGSLNAGEAMVFENISFLVLNLSGTNLTLDATTISLINPVSQVDPALVSLKEALQLGLLNITIANQKVVKDYNVFEQNVNYNPKTTGAGVGVIATTATFDTLVYPQEYVGQNTIQLESPPVLPPNQKVEISLEIPPIGTVAAGTAVMCVVGRFGSLFSAKTTL